MNHNPMHSQENNTDIGKLILQKLGEQGRSIVWLAEKVCCDDSNLGKTLKNSQFIYFDLLLRISIAMDEDFFAYGSQLLKEIKHGKIHRENR